MHAAPPVRMTLAPDRPWCLFLVGCASAAAANLAAWAVLWARAPTATAAVAAVLAAGLAGSSAWRVFRRRHAVSGALSWDGAVWQWAPDSAQPSTGEVRVMLDLGAWMLLRFVPEAPAPHPAWLAVSRRQGGALWSPWRAALLSRRLGTEPNTAADPS